MSAATSALTALPARFFAWWLGELAACVPATLRRRFARQGDTLIIDVMEDAAVVRRQRRGTLEELGRVSLADDASVATEIARLARRIVGRGAEIRLRLPAHQVLRRTVDLPLAAVENLREVVAFEMDRHTPFRAEEVYYDFRVLGSDLEAKRLSVDLAVVRRPILDRAMQFVAGGGLRADSAGIDGDERASGSPLNFLPAGRDASAGRLGRRISAALGLAAAALLTAAVYLPLHEKQVRLSEIEARLDRARSEAAVADSLRKQVTEMLEQSRFVVEQREVQPTVVALLDVVTKLLPDDTWLIRFRVSKRQVQMSGYSAAASSLIATLEASELLTEVRFASPVTLDPRVGRERFDLTASIAQGAGS